jgi:hypothetical protein
MPRLSRLFPAVPTRALKAANTTTIAPIATAAGMILRIMSAPIPTGVPVQREETVAPGRSLGGAERWIKEPDSVAMHLLRQEQLANSGVK